MLWETLYRRRRIFLAAFVAGTLAAFLISLLLPNRYEAVGQLTVDFEAADSLGLDALAQATGVVDAETKLQTQVSVLQTDSLAWEVIKKLRLDQKPEAAHQRFVIGPVQCMTPPGGASEKISPECRRTLLDEFRARLRVQSVPKTEIIEIRFRSKSRELASIVVNTLAETYVERNFQTKYQSGMRVSSWLTGQLDDVKRSAELAETNFINYQKRTGVIGTDENHNVLVERLNAINQQLVSAQANRIVREARYRIASEGDPESLVEIAAGSPLQLMLAQQSALKNEYAQLDTKFGDAYPRVIQAKAQLEQAEQSTKLELLRTKQHIKDEYEAALKSESLLRDEFERQKLQAYKTNQAATQVGLLKREVDASRELYEQLSKKLKEAGILAGLKSRNVTIIDPAEIPVKPAEPRPVFNLAMGMFLGSLGGLGLAFLKESIDTRITTPQDVLDVGSLPSLGIVPRLTDWKLNGASSNGNRTGRHHVIALERPESEIADAYRSLRTALLLSNAGAPPKVVLVTSPLPREGKTTTCVNTAVVFAQKKQRVLLVDGDLRRADVHRLLGLPGNGGLSAALIGEEPSQFYVKHPELPTLTILPAGKRPPKPPDLLDSDRMRELVSAWRNEFDQVIIDAPPIIGMSDSVILATMADLVVIVLRAEQSRRPDLYRAHEILSSVDANIGGAIINDFDLTGPGYYGTSPALYGRYFSNNDNGDLHANN